MTTYKFKYLKEREIGDGVETTCYNTWGESREVQVFTTAKSKWEYLRFLGLVTTPQRRVRIEYSTADYYHRRTDTPPTKYYRYRWMFNVVKLEPLTYKQWDELTSNPKYGKEMSMLRQANDMRSMHLLNPEDFTILRPCVEFLVKYKVKSTRVDSHRGNWLICPITGYIYPYDVVFIPDEL